MESADPLMTNLSAPWVVPHPWHFAVAILLFGLLVRLLMALLRGTKQAHEIDGGLRTFWKMVWFSIRGYQPKESNRSSDYWYTYILGCMELSAYPVLIGMNGWLVIGAWIGLKTLAQWSVWKEDRSIFNLFLIGNLLVLGIAYLFLTPMIVVQVKR